MSLLIILTIAVSLSMDAFSLSIAYGTLNLKKSYIKKLSLMVGIFHFFMPLIGLTLGNIILKIIPINPNYIVCIVLTFIGIEMIIESFQTDEEPKLKTTKELITFGLAVSIDSFSVGIGLKAISNNYILASLIFSITSFIFTYTGLIIGKEINKLIGKISTLIGGIILIIIGITFII